MQIRIEIITIVILFIGTLFFAWLPHATQGSKGRYKIFESFACGIFFAAALLIFIPDMINQSNNFSTKSQNHYIVSAFIIMGSTFLVFLFLEHLVSRQRGKNFKNITKINYSIHRSKTPSNKNHYQNQINIRYFNKRSNKNTLKHSPRLLSSHSESLKFSKRQEARMMGVFFLILVIHSYLAGFGISIYFQHRDNQILFFLLIICGILVHKFTISFTLSVYLKKHGFTSSKICILMLIFSIMTPLGIVSTHVFHLTHLANWIVTSIAGGVFLFLGTLHGLYNSVLIKRCCNFNYFLFVILGFIITAIPAFFLNTI